MLCSASASSRAPQGHEIDHRAVRLDAWPMPSIEEAIAALKPSGTVWYTVSNVCLDGGVHPLRLLMKYAGKGNPGYWSAALKILNENRNQPSRKITDARINEKFEQDAQLFAKHVVVEWEHAYENGKTLPCTPENVLKVLRAIAEYLPDTFLLITDHARDSDNYRDAGVTAGVDLGKG
jgi:hypothetical protein